MGYFFSEKESNELVQKIHEIESKTQGEVRIHIEDNCEGDAVERAIEVFDILKMYNTKEKTGVLIYLATESKKTAIIGDSGIDAKVPNEFWDTVIVEMEKKFSEFQYVDGLIIGLDMAGAELAKNFPKKEGNPDELSNEISYGQI